MRSANQRASIHGGSVGRPMIRRSKPRKRGDTAGSSAWAISTGLAPGRDTMARMKRIASVTRNDASSSVSRRARYGR